MDARAKVKLCVVGDRGVGKTSLIARYVLNEFAESYLVAVGTRVSKKKVEVTVARQRVSATLLIWDILGREDFRSLIDTSYLSGAQGVLLVADITRGETLDGLGGWMSRVRATAPHAHIALVGNKADLCESRAFEIAKLVTFAEENQAALYLTSAKQGDGVNRAFEEVAADILQTAGPEPPRKRAVVPEVPVSR